MAKVERTLKLDEDAAALLIQLAGSERKQGEFVSALIREKARQDPLLARLAQMEEELARLRLEILRRAEQPPAGEGEDGRRDASE
jgi:hypothetical protein